MKKNSSKYNFSSRESINELSKDELVDAVLLLGAKLQQLSDVMRDMVTAKHGRKTERFDDPGQLNIFPTNLGDSPNKEEPESATKSSSKPKV